MRNIFHQYRQPENQLSHALATVLARESALCTRFTKWLVGFDPPRGAELKVEQQRVPGIPTIEPDESDRKGLPDICIHSDSDWCVAIESKVSATLTSDQLMRHRQTVGRCYERVMMAAITAETEPRELPKWVAHKTWEQVYVWMGEQVEKDGVWVEQMRDFMRILESRLVAEVGGLPGSLTMFDGIPFGAQHSYSYPEAKLLIRQAIPLLRKSNMMQILGVDSACKGRSAITGKDSTRVWDYISLRPAGQEGDFTEWPHLTMGIHGDITEARVTMPNSIKTVCRTSFRKLGEEGFIELSGQIAENMKKEFGESKGYKPVMKIVHRHYASQRSEAEIDGDMEIDLRAAFGDEQRRVKRQPHWFRAGYQLITDRQNCNIQLQMGVNFLHTEDLVRGSAVISTLERAYAACSPLIDVLLRDYRVAPSS